jgi:glutamate dehydrogenase/leucine dehydrogenase
MMRARTVMGAFTGKPLDFGGSHGREEATGRGVFLCTRSACDKLGRPLGDLTVAIQGFGNAGVYSAKFLAEAGCRVVAASDSGGAIHRADGLDWRKLRAHKQATGSVVGFEGAEGISPESLLELEVDVLVPAALENQIRSHNAPRIKASIIAEAANGPCTPAADQILRDNKVLVIPDILANAGGVTVSYYEWVQNRNGDHWSEEVVDEKLRAWMDSAFEQVWAASQRYEVDMRTAAYIVGVERICAGYKVRGIWP